jgi:hypothetical protein
VEEKESAEQCSQTGLKIEMARRSDAAISESELFACDLRLGILQIKNLGLLLDPERIGPDKVVQDRLPKY